MHKYDYQVLLAAQRWALAGHRFALITVAKTWGSSPRPVGAWMILRDDGLVQGSVSGGCVEDDLIQRMKAGEFNAPRIFIDRYGVTQEEAHRFGLPCGGTLELVIETSPALEKLNTLAERTAKGQIVIRRVDVVSNAVEILDGTRQDQHHWNQHCLTLVYGPIWRLLIIGAGEISRYLAQMAKALDFQIFICDPRDEYALEWDISDTTITKKMPDDVVMELALDSHSAVVALTHDPKLDDMALLEALKSSAFYVGALGSTRNNIKRKERLLEYFDLTETEVNRLHGPVGLPIGSHTPAEIAISILAEIIAVKNGIDNVMTTSHLAHSSIQE